MRVRRVVDVAVEVGADLGDAEVEPGEPHLRLRRELDLARGVVLELQVGVDLHQVGPVGTASDRHTRPSSLVQRPSMRTSPDSSPSGYTTNWGASSSQWYGWSPAESVKPK